MACQVGDESPPGSRGTAAPDALGAEDFAASGQGLPEEVPDQEPAAAPGITGENEVDHSTTQDSSQIAMGQSSGKLWWRRKGLL